MALDSICQYAARFAAFAAIALLLLQASCPIQFMPPAATAAFDAGNMGCHETAPPAPEAPVSGHHCCNGDHYPGALLSAAQVVPPPSMTIVAEDAAPQCTSIANFSRSMVVSLCRPRGSLPLRI